MIAIVLFTYTVASGDIIKMAEISNQIHRDKYDSAEVQLFAAKFKQEPTNAAFLFPAAKEYLALQATGKKVLDIGCGTGIWVKYAAECGAKSVDGFDISVDMVELSKQSTAGLSNVEVTVGNVSNMPYDDNTFDVALSFFVTCTLQVEAYIKHFKELHRVLSPGGKAVVVSIAKSVFDDIIYNVGANQVLLEEMIQSKLAKLSKQPTNEQINEALADLDDVILATFALDESGTLYRVTDTSQLLNGHPVWTKNRVMSFPDHYYSNEFLQDQIKAAGLCVDQIECHCTEERRIAYNTTSQGVQLEKKVTDNPPHFLYHLSKPKL